MKRIIIILAALAILMSACINPIPPPSSDQDPVVELSTSGGAVGQDVRINTEVTDDTGGELEHIWFIEDTLVQNSEVTHTNTQGLELDVLRTNSGHTATYTFGAPPYSIDGRSIYYDGEFAGFDSVRVDVYDQATVSIAGYDYTIRVISRNDASDTTVETVRFTIDGDPVNLDVGVPRVLSLSGYSVTVTVLDAQLNSNEELVSVDVQAAYTYQGLTQQQQVRFTPTEGVRITLPEGTIVEAYLEGAVLRSDYSSIVLSVDGESEIVTVGEPAWVSERAVLVLNATGTSGLESSMLASVVIGSHLIELESGSITGVVAGSLATISSTQNGFIFQSSESRDPFFNAYDWAGPYYVDTTLVEINSIAAELLSLVPKQAGTYTVYLTVTDERGNSGSDSVTFSVE